MSYRPQFEARQRNVERRQREDAAPRLKSEFPRLSGLRLEIENGDSKYAWPIVVAYAPALFNIVCSDGTCKDGGHDVTMDIMAALRKTSARMEGNDVCQGQVGSSPCGRTLRYVGVATYNKAE